MQNSNLPQAHTILDVKQETENLKSFRFSGNLGAKPGQFVMVWIPEIDEKPVSVAYSDEKEFRIAVAAVGTWSNAMCELEVGDKVGIRGPYGTTFSWKKGEHIVLVGGGFGVMPMYFTAREALKDGCTIDFIVGARRASLVPYAAEVEALGANVNFHPCTDDGSMGFHGFTTQKLEEIIGEKKVDRVMTCGPEMMMKKIAEMCQGKGIACEVSVERYMKCGIGVCGNCVTDPKGDRMCVEGPVVDGEKALTYADFGVYHRNSSGSKHA